MAGEAEYPTAPSVDLPSAGRPSTNAQEASVSLARGSSCPGSVYGPVQLTVFARGGLVLAGAGAMLPAGWAAKTRTATALRTE